MAHILIEVERLSAAERTELHHAIVERISMSDDLTVRTGKPLPQRDPATMPKTNFDSTDFISDDRSGR